MNPPPAIIPMPAITQKAAPRKQRTAIIVPRQVYPYAYLLFSLLCCRVFYSQLSEIQQRNSLRQGKADVRLTEPLRPPRSIGAFLRDGWRQARQRGWRNQRFGLKPSPR